MDWKIPLFKIYWDQADIRAVSSVVRRGTYWATGPEIVEFENCLAGYFGVKHAVTFNSGTSALHLLLLAHGIQGKEVIVPTFTFIATANAVLLAGGKPVFAESESETFGLDARDVEKRVTKDTGGVIQLHYGGMPGRDTIALRDLCRKRGILLIEDAAESLGSSIDGKPVGTFGDSAIFSFCHNKVITTGEGGVILTNSEEVFQKAVLLRSHGRVETGSDYFSSTGDNDYIQVGYNYRMPTMGAALGLSQLAKVDRVIKMRRRVAHAMTRGLSELDGVKRMPELPGHFQVYQMYTIKLNDEMKRDALQEFLAKKGIMSKVYFNPVHLKTVYSNGYGYHEGDLPLTEELSRTVLTLPMYARMTNEEIAYLVGAMKEFFEAQR
jgi:perosamine synthetase